MTRMSTHFACGWAIRLCLTVLLIGSLATAVSEAAMIQPIPRTGGHEYLGRLQTQLKTLFPDSAVELNPLQNHVVVTGQASTFEESEIIMRIVRSAVAHETLATTGKPIVDLDAAVLNELEFPPPAQVMLHIKIVEIERVQLENLKTLREGSRVSGGGIHRVCESIEIQKLFNDMVVQGVGRIVAAPTLTVLSGHTASSAIGEFPVPTIVGVSGPQGVATSYHGASRLLIKPEVLESGVIKLNIAAENSKSNGAPEATAEFTTSRLSQGQSVVVTGLLTARQTRTGKIPFLAELPVINATIRKRRQRQERTTTEVMMLVTPELVRPMEPTEAPPQPWFTVPSDTELYTYKRTEGPLPGDGKPTLAPWPISGPSQTPRPIVALLPGPGYQTDDVQYFPPGPEFRLAGQFTPRYPLMAEEAPILKVEYAQTAPAPAHHNPVTDRRGARGSQSHGPFNHLEPVSAPRPNWWLLNPSTERLGHLQRALSALQAAGLTEQVMMVEREIAKEQLAWKEREAEELQRQILLLRRTLGVPAPIPDSLMPAASW